MGVDLDPVSWDTLLMTDNIIIDGAGIEACHGTVVKVEKASKKIMGF